MKVVFKAEAEADVERIVGDWVRNENPRAALALVRALRESTAMLEHTPLAFPLLPGFETEGLRRRVHRDYLILYRVTPDQVEIVHVVHGARDYERLLRGSRG